MKQDLFPQLNSKERYGLIAMLVLISFCFILSILLRNCNNNFDQQDSLVFQKEWNQLEQSDTGSYQKNRNINNANLFYFDPNALDSMDFVRLGLENKTIHYLINWRNKGKIFYKKEDFKALYTLSPETYLALEPFIQIENTKTNNHYKAYPSAPNNVNLNRCDAATLELLKGIGPVLAQKIIQYREVLGGFLTLEQLLEIYKFHDTTYNYLKEKIVINPQDVNIMELNHIDIERLSKHPYIGETMAKNILMYGKDIGGYRNISQLRQVPLMNDKKYRKIAPYFKIE